MPDAVLSALVMNSFNPPSGTLNPHPTPCLQILLHSPQALQGLACAHSPPPPTTFLSSSFITFLIPHHSLASLALFLFHSSGPLHWLFPLPRKPCSWMSPDLFSPYFRDQLKRYFHRGILPHSSIPKLTSPSHIISQLISS